MASLRLFAPSCKGASADNCRQKGLQVRSSQITSALAHVSACSLVAASAGFGSLFAFQQGSEHGPLMAILSLVFALGLELAKPIALVGALSAFRSFAIGRGAALMLLAT